MRHGGQILIDQLRIQGVKQVFCIPGESYLPALDGLYKSDIKTKGSNFIGLLKFNKNIPIPIAP